MAIIRPSWPLGTRFTDSKKRIFQVVKVVMGNPENKIGYKVELADGCIIESELGEHPQKKAGFVDIRNTDNVIIELVEDLDQFVRNGHLKVIRYGY